MGASNWVDVTHIGTGASVTASSLERNKSYDFQVRAVNDSGEGEWSDPLSASTTRTPIAEISAVSTSVVEGDGATFNLALDVSGTVSVGLRYAWMGGYGSPSDRVADITADTSLDFLVMTRDIFSSVNGSIEVTILPGTGYIVGANSSATVTDHQKDQTTHQTERSVCNRGNKQRHHRGLGAPDQRDDDTGL